MTSAGQSNTHKKTEMTVQLAAPKNRRIKELNTVHAASFSLIKMTATRTWN